MTTNTTSHHVSHPVTPTWLEDPALPSPPDPLKQTNTSPTAPNHSIAPSDIAKNPKTPFQSPASIPLQPNPQEPHEHGSSVSTSYNNRPSPSPPLLSNHLQPSNPFSHLTPPLPTHPQPYHDRTPTAARLRTAPDPKQPSRTAAFLNPAISSALQPETLPPSQFSHHNQTREYRPSNAANRFSSLLTVSNQETAQYPRVIPSLAHPAHSEPLLPPMLTASAAPVSTSVPTHHHKGDPVSSYPALRDNHPLHNFNYTSTALRPHPYEPSHPQVKLFDGMAQIRKQDKYFRHSHAQGDSLKRKMSTASHQRHGRVYPQWQDRVQHSSLSHPEVNATASYPSQVMNYRQHSVRPGPPGNEPSQFLDHASELVMPSRAIPHEKSHDNRSASIPFIAMEGSWDSIVNAAQSLEEDGNSVERARFFDTYERLIKEYEARCAVIYDTADSSCSTHIINSRIPYLVDSITAPVEDETPEDVQQKLVVKQKFVEAMEKLQADQMPTKRRGNLPKESTAYLKKWFENHYDHPCKFCKKSRASCSAVIG
ncbi:unnamed protein product [Chondrus crispus]|uniref:Uncharacterized protein n=1 Tax=Chondrus crispus TaxID=2769 RepID=R7QEN5_CHOCR|nr:unnamed protein product [Chondrus crispus]CDF36967.1 unnamed protein product [Chondrus crispus]|eukprot:XP_005716786.1 unnamed protein product [Chondrus crispus]